MKTTLATLFLVSSLAAQITTVPSSCPTTTNNVPRLFEYDEFMYSGQPFTVEVFTDPYTTYFVAIGLPQASIDAGLASGYAPWGVNQCFLIAWDVYTGASTTNALGRDFWTFNVPNDPQLINTDLLIQAYVGCAGCPMGAAPTNGLAATIQQ